MTTQSRFNAGGALKTARGFHFAAGQLETIHQQHLGRVPKGTSLDPEIINQIVGRVAGAVVLEALAIELVIKVRLDRAGIRVWQTHNHSKLFAKLPECERKQVEQRYESRRHPAMRRTLEDVLASSADLFVKWRYMHEHSQVDASMREMQRAFGVLVDGL